ncbi:probable methyltransferase BTM2 homolog [Fopius arisanus]|uniref:S-adenosylmethionine sensor upstream of mTORC1 n=1 Tax=Fopius arisanus TaxID=64838 RepID=A0A0C9R4C9_9HYME|nr:PREDICTED: probable methyltransferase BTM2 homolog [Fopius arisanus]
MATEKHKELSGFIKEIHNRLRRESQLYGSEEAWNRHLSRTRDLQNYADSMKELATAHWTQSHNSLHKNPSTHCRIHWIKKQCYKYYFEKGKDKYDEREQFISFKIEGQGSSILPTTSTFSPPGENDCLSPRIRILDVGSCYNPLGDDGNFDVTPIDLAPYSNHVLKCDFLDVSVGKTTETKDNQEVISLGRNNYDVCVFSLLLEYLPSPDQRFHCCKKAYDILKPGGLLIIITPDSKHVGANAKIMKSWRFVLAHLGFMRITYEKLTHIHCISFRKCFDKKVAARWAEMQNFDKDKSLFNSLNKIFIPQDFQEIKEIKSFCVEGEKGTFYSESEKSIGFGELPEFFDGIN